MEVYGRCEELVNVEQREQLLKRLMAICRESLTTGRRIIGLCSIFIYTTKKDQKSFKFKIIQKKLMKCMLYKKIIILNKLFTPKVSSFKSGY